MLDDRVDEVGFVAQEEDRGVGCGRNGKVEITGSCARIASAGEPEVVAAAFDGDVAVDEDRGAVGFEYVDDLLGADGYVVVAQDGVALRSFEGGQDFRADACGLEGEGWIAGTAADEVSGKEDEFGVEGVDASDGVFEEGRFGELLEVDVGELDHAEALEGVRELVDGESARDDLELVAGVET